jgi:sporulation integral membrane protein YtvI
MPRLIFAFFAAVAALFYMCLGSFELTPFIQSLLPAGIVKWGSRYVRRIISVLGRYVKAYGTVMLMTFSELLLGTVILRVNYALAASAMIAALDVLPVLGVGTILVPWSAISFIMGDSYRGVGLLILYGVIYTVRQIAEPRILSGSMGMDPLAALFSVYAGFRLFGVWGMILAPIMTCAVLETVKSGRERGETTICGSITHDGE